MALFGNLFEKKHCDICGSEIGLLGNRKLEDGNLCKNCAAKLSPWFSDRRRSTVEEIRAQLEYREQNKENLAGFNPTEIYGHKTKIYIDDTSRKMIVTRSSKWREENPDLIDLDKIQDCIVNVIEHKEEIYTKDKDGKRASYNPKRYNYEYEYRVDIAVDSPYYPEISFELTDERPTDKHRYNFKEYAYEGNRIQHRLLPEKYPLMEVIEQLDVITQPDQVESENWTCECGQENTGNFCSNCGKPKPVRWFCPDCGRENYGTFCINCGRKKPEY